MATRNYTFPAKPQTIDYDGVAIVEWTGLLNTDDGQPIELVQFSDRSIQVTGTFGAGGNLRIQGSLDGVNWAVLTDPQGNDLNITTAKIEAVAEMTTWIRPLVTAGDVSTNLTVRLVARRD